MSQQPIGSNQGINLIKQARVGLTNDVIKALPTSPITAITAPGQDKIIISPVQYMLGQFPIIFNWYANYTNVNADAALLIKCGDNGPICGYDSNNSDFATFLAWGASVAFIPISNDALSPQSNMNDIVNIANQALTIEIDNQGDGDLEDGDPLNNIIITIPYMIYNLVSGLFE